MTTLTAPIATQTTPAPVVATPPDDFSPDDLMPSWITADEMHQFDDGRLYELVDGQLVEKPMSDYANFVANRTSKRLIGWSGPTNAGESFVESTFQCFPGRPGLVRRPDVAFISSARLAGYGWDNAHIRLAPDVAVEVVSPRDKWYDVNDKIGEYHAAGVPLVLVADPIMRTVLVHPNGGKPRLLSADDDLGDDPAVAAELPGFRCRVGDLFPARPSGPAVTPA